MADDEDDIILSELSDDELIEQMHQDLYDGLKEEIEEGVNILLERGWEPYKALTEALVEGMRIVGIDFRDGILFVPSHYYMAVLGRQHLSFVRSEDSAVFEAFARAVAGLDLRAASRAIERGRVVDTESGRSVDWPAPRMVLPVSPALRERLRSAGPAGDHDLPSYRLEPGSVSE